MVDLNKTPYRELDIWSRWPLRAIGDKYFVELQSPALSQGLRQLLAVLDVTDLAPRLQLNQGQINNDGKLIWGPGEVYANVGSEGDYAIILLKDGTEKQTKIQYITAIVKLETPTGDDLYNESNFGT